MPQAFVKKLADKHDMSLKKAEGKWKKAVAAAEKQYGKATKKNSSKVYGTATKIFKSMMGESETKTFENYFAESKEHAYYFSIYYKLTPDDIGQVMVIDACSAQEALEAFNKKPEIKKHEDTYNILGIEDGVDMEKLTKHLLKKDILDTKPEVSRKE